MLGLAWDPGYLRSFKGMAMLAQILVAGIGGIISLITGAGFEQFIFWSVFCISGVLLFAALTNITNILEAKIPYFGKLRLYYLLVWIVLTSICLIIEIVTFLVSFVYIILNIGLLMALVIDLVITWRTGVTIVTMPTSSSVENLEPGAGPERF